MQSIAEELMGKEDHMMSYLKGIYSFSGNEKKDTFDEEFED
jgi:hypothetical protein